MRYPKIAMTHIFRKHIFDGVPARINFVKDRRSRPRGSGAAFIHSAHPSERVIHDGSLEEDFSRDTHRRIRRTLACCTCIYAAARAKKEGATRSEANEVQIERGRAAWTLEICTDKLVWPVRE